MCWYLYRQRTGFERRELVFSCLQRRFDIHVQNRLSDCHFNDLQYQLWYADQVRIYAMSD
jgi:hypothetical protein